MMDNSLLVADPTKVAPKLQSAQNDLSQELDNRADKTFLEKTKILKHPNIV